MGKEFTKKQSQELYIEMMTGFANEGPAKVESMILRMGRTDMHQFCAYLFIRSLETDLTNQRLVKLI